MTTHRTLHPRRWLAVAVAVLFAATACGLGDKQAQAEKIAGSRDLALSTKTAKGTLRVEMIPLERPLGLEFPEIPENQPPPMSLWIDVEVAFDFENGRVQSIIPVAANSHVPTAMRPVFEFEVDPNALQGAAAQAQAQAGGEGAEGVPAIGDGGEGAGQQTDQQAAEAAGEALQDALATQPEGEAAPTVEGGTPGTAVFRNSVSFLKRTTMREGERRSWAKLDYRRLEEDEIGLRTDLTALESLHVAAATVNPQFVLDMVIGVLSGSVEVRGPDTLGEIPVTKYQANFSREKVTQELELKDEFITSRGLTFSLLGISGGDVQPGEFWLDEEGRIRRVQLDFPQNLRNDIRNTLRFTLDLPEYGVAVEVPAPGDQETIEVDRYGRVIRAGMPIVPEQEG